MNDLNPKRKLIVTDIVKTMLYENDDVLNNVELLNNKYGVEFSIEEELLLLEDLEKTFMYNPKYLEKTMKNFEIAIVEDKKYIKGKVEDQVDVIKEEFNKGFKQSIEDAKKEFKYLKTQTEKIIKEIGKDTFSKLGGEGTNILTKIIEKLPDKLEEIELEDFNDEQKRIVKIFESIPNDFLIEIKELLEGEKEKIEGDMISIEEMGDKIQKLLLKKLKSFLKTIETKELKILDEIKDVMSEGKLKLIGEIGSSLNDKTTKENLKITKINLELISKMEKIEDKNSKEYKELKNQLVKYPDLENDTPESIMMKTKELKMGFIEKYHSLTSFTNISNTIQLKDMLKVVDITNPKKQAEGLKELTTKLITKLTTDIIIKMENSTLETDSTYLSKSTLKANRSLEEDIVEMIMDINEDDPKKIIAIALYIKENMLKMDSKSLALTRSMNNEKESKKIIKTVMNMYKKTKKTLKSFESLESFDGNMKKKIDSLSNEMDIFTRLQKTVNEEISSFEEDVDKVEELENNLESSITDFKDDIYESINEVTDIYNEQKEKMENTISEMDDIIESLITSIKKLKIEGLDITNISNIEDILNIDINNEDLKKLLENIKKINKQKEDVEKVMVSQKKSFENSIKEMENIYEGISESINNISNNKDEIVENLKDLSDKYKSKFEEYKNIKGNITNMFPESMKVLKMYKDLKDENIGIKESLKRKGRESIKYLIEGKDKLTLSFKKIFQKKEYKKLEKENQYYLTMMKLMKSYGIKIKLNDEGKEEINEQHFIKELSDIHQFKMRVFYRQKKNLIEINQINKLLNSEKYKDGKNKSDRITLKNKLAKLKIDKKEISLLYLDEMSKKFKNKSLKDIKSEYTKSLEQFLKIDKRNNFLKLKGYIDKLLGKEEIGFYTEEEKIFKIFRENNKNIKISEEYTEILEGNEDIRKFSYEVSGSKHILKIGENKDIRENIKEDEEIKPTKLEEEMILEGKEIISIDEGEEENEEEIIFDEDKSKEIINIEKRINVISKYSTTNPDPNLFYQRYTKLLEDTNEKILSLKNRSEQKNQEKLMKKVLMYNLEELVKRDFLLKKILEEEKMISDSNSYSDIEIMTFQEERYKILSLIEETNIFLRTNFLFSEEEYYCPYEHIKIKVREEEKIYESVKEMKMVEILTSNRRYFSAIGGLKIELKEGMTDEEIKVVKSNRSKILIDFNKFNKMEMVIDSSINTMKETFPEKIEDKNKFLENLFELKVATLDSLNDVSISNKEIDDFLKIINNNKDGENFDIEKILKNSDSKLFKLLKRYSEFFDTGFDISKSKNKKKAKMVTLNESKKEFLNNIIKSYSISIESVQESREKMKISKSYGKKYNDYSNAVEELKEKSKTIKIILRTNDIKEIRDNKVNTLSDTIETIIKDLGVDKETLLEIIKDNPDIDENIKKIVENQTNIFNGSKGILELE